MRLVWRSLSQPLCSPWNAGLQTFLIHEDFQTENSLDWFASTQSLVEIIRGLCIVRICYCLGYQEAHSASVMTQLDLRNLPYQSAGGSLAYSWEDSYELSRKLELKLNRILSKQDLMEKEPSSVSLLEETVREDVWWWSQSPEGRNSAGFMSKEILALNTVYGMW